MINDNLNLSIIFIIGFIDSMGIGLIVPVLPKLLISLHVRYFEQNYGLLLACYPLFQLVFAPILGYCSDRFDKKLILLISLVGTGINYIIMAYARQLIWLYIARILAGITSSNIVIANSMLASISTEKNRIQRFGWLHACVGLGFTLGPTIGGLLGHMSIRYPFFFSFGLTTLCVMLSAWLIPRSREKNIFIYQSIKLSQLSRKLKIPLFVLFSILCLASQAPNALWALYTQTYLHWNCILIGISYSIFGASITLSRVLLPSILVKILKERNTFIFTIVLEIIAYTILALTHQTWVIFALMLPCASIGSIWEPLLHSYISKKIAKNKQGMLQGNIASLGALASLLAPIFTTNIFSITKHYIPGFIWILVAIMYGLALRIAYTVYDDQ